MSRQVFPVVCTASTTNNLATNPMNPNGLDWVSSGFATVARIHKDTTISRLFIYLSGAIGGTATWTIFKNGSSTALTVTIAGANTSGSDTSNTVAFAAGDTIEIRRTTSGVNSVVNWITWQSDTDDAASAIHGYRSGNISNTVNAYLSIFNGRNNDATAEGQTNVVAAPGTIDGYHITLSTAPGVGNTREFWIYKNGIKQDGTGGTVNTLITISGASTTGSASFSLSVTRGDLLYIETTPTSGPATSNVRTSVGFVADVSGESNFAGFNAGTIADVFMVATGHTTTSASETDTFRHKGGWNGIYLRNMTVNTNGNSTSDSFLRVNGASSSLTVSLVNTTDGQNNNQQQLADNDIIGMFWDSTAGTPFSERWAFVMSASAAVTDTPFYQTEWPNPEITRKQNLGSIGNFAGLISPPTPIQNSQTDWPNPLIGKRPHVGWVDYYIIEDFNFKPNGDSVLPERIEGKKSGPGWIQPRPLYYEDEKPFKQDDWPNPALKFKPAITHIHNRKIDEPPTPEPFKIPLFPNPLLKKRINPSWTDNFSLEETFTHPVGSSVQDLPVLKTKPPAITWINPRPTYYEEPAVIVFKQNSWPNPLSRKTLNRVHNRHFVDSPVTTTPFSQKDWPLPLRKKVSIKWEDYYVIDENLPFVQQLSFVPLRKSVFTPTWIRPSITVEDAGTPIVPYDYPNPIIVKQHTKTWIDNLLQSTLDPGEGEKPFNQNDYPNPLIGLKLLHTGWLDSRRFYFDEPPLQIGQFDWPVFRAVVRNTVGHIHSQKQDENPPKFVSIDTVPLVKNIMGISWIDNPIIIITTVPGLKPFNQNDWPNPRLKIPYFNNFNIFRPTSLIPPFIKGRKICLDASLIIYDLEAMLEEYDLNARATEYYLDADGTECE